LESRKCLIGYLFCLCKKEKDARPPPGSAGNSSSGGRTTKSGSSVSENPTETIRKLKNPGKQIG